MNEVSADANDCFVSPNRFRDNEGDLNGATRPVPDACGDNVLPLRNWNSQGARISMLPLEEVS